LQAKRASRVPHDASEAARQAPLSSSTRRTNFSESWRAGSHQPACQLIASSSICGSPNRRAMRRANMVFPARPRCRSPRSALRSLHFLAGHHSLPSRTQMMQACCRSSGRRSAGSLRRGRRPVNSRPYMTAMWRCRRRRWCRSTRCARRQSDADNAARRSSVRCRRAARRRTAAPRRRRRSCCG
jgi:hypothetical protein